MLSQQYPPIVAGPASSVEASPEEKNARGDGGVAQLQEIAADAILVQPVGPVDPPVEAQAPAPTPTRSKRASALKASAKLNNWHAVEGLPFSHIVGKDIYLPANRPAGTGESRRTRDRNRAAQHPSQSGATPGGPGTQTPPPPARTSRPKDKPQSQTEPRPAAKPSRATTERVINYAEDEVEDESEIEVESDRDEDFSIKGYKKKGKGQHQKPASKRQKTAATAPAPPVDPALDTMLGCGKCRYAKGGCNTCRAAPQFSRPRARWDPSRGHHQDGIPTVKPFRPTPEEFKDPIAYITKIMPEAAPYGLAHIIPPEGWAPPFALEKGTNGANMDSFRFSIRRQLTSHLCYRAAPQRSTGGDAEGAQAGGGAAESRYGRKLTQQPQQQADATVKAERDGMAVENASNASPRTISGEGAPAPSSEDRPLTADDVRAALAAVGGLLPGEPGPAPPEAQPLPPVHSTQENASGGTAGGVAAPHSPPHTEPVPPARGGATANSSDDGSEGSAEDGSDGVAEFGFAMLDKKLTLRSFAAYADWAKSVHFSNPPPTGEGTSTEPKKRPTKMLPLLHTLAKEPSVEEVEAEFWRIVETPDSHLESLYGQDLDSGHHGSGFPLPEWRRRLLEEHLCATRRSMGGGSYSGGEVRLPGYSNETEREYAEHSWNINNMPRCKSSMLRYLLGDGLITGVMVPWLYVGSCLSAFCWHVEDHALYSVNYHHLGAPKVWYGVPASATTALEEAMKDALPHLFEASPHLLYQLVTMLSPKQLQVRSQVRDAVKPTYFYHLLMYANLPNLTLILFPLSCIRLEEFRCTALSMKPGHS